jgi:site-specific DNA-cytosine methylase
MVRTLWRGESVKILSLFDGMACGMIAMLNAGIEVESYDAYEIDKHAMKVSSHNFPNIQHHGDVFQADFTQYEGVDYLVGGSPCTYWSIARKTIAKLKRVAWVGNCSVSMYGPLKKLNQGSSSMRTTNP